MLPLRISLVRHGRSLGNDGAKEYHQTGKWPEYLRKTPQRFWDISEEGKIQSQALALWLKTQPAYDLYFHSELVRAKQTAHLLACSEPWENTNLLNEQETGVFANMPLHERKEKHPKYFDAVEKNPFTARPPGGESLSDKINDVRAFLGQRLDHTMPVKRVLVVTHQEWILLAMMFVEKMKEDVFNAYYRNAILENDSSLKIHNGMLVEYSRQNPEDPTDIRDWYFWKRRFWPYKPEVYDGKWQTIL